LKGPEAIPDYLAMKFKEKEEQKQKLKMMGDDSEGLKAKLNEMEIEN